jgi:hypothetical protein
VDGGKEGTDILCNVLRRRQVDCKHRMTGWYSVDLEVGGRLQGGNLHQSWPVDTCHFPSLLSLHNSLSTEGGDGLSVQC